MAITFGGLATGLDTNSIVDGLMQVERSPLIRLESDKVWLNSRLSAFKEFDTALNSFYDSAKTLANQDAYSKKISTLSTSDYLSVATSDSALANTSYDVEVISLAQVQKTHVDNSFSSETDLIFNPGTIEITVDGTAHSITISATDASLEGVTNAINEANIGVTAGILDDGSLIDPFRLTLTGSKVSETFTIDATGIAGTESIGTTTNYQDAGPASIEVDGIAITSNSNTITDAIQGLVLNLVDSEVGKTTTISTQTDTSTVSTNINAFVTGYNEVVSFVTKQSTFGDSQGGILSGDSGLNSVKRRLQNLLTTMTSNEGSFKALSQLGLETQSDGTLALDSDTLNSAVSEDLDGIISLLAGDENGNGGIATQFEDYLDGLTDSTQGLYAGREQSITQNLNRIDDSIVLMEMRLEKREEILRSQFNSMELLISTLNSQGDYLSQQLESISQIGKNK